MSNGHYSVMVTATGSGYSRWNELAVTRWQADPTEDRLGTYHLPADAATGEWWSATAEPQAGARTKRCRRFSPTTRRPSSKSVGTLRSEVECIVVSEGNGEGRRVTITNGGATDRLIEVTSFAELALAPEISDSAHPAFSKMFVETEISEDKHTIFASRRKRDKNDPDIAFGHFVTDGSGFGRDIEAETDRRAFIGRGRSIGNAAAFDPGAKLTGAHGFVLDPIAAIRRRVSDSGPQEGLAHLLDRRRRRPQGS